MLSSLDYSFNYKFFSRFLIMHKLNLLNNFTLPIIDKIIFFFSLKDLETLDDARVYNYFFFFKFFLGRRAFFSGYKSFFNLGKTTFNVKIQMILNKSDVFNALLFMSNDVFAFLDLSYISAKMSRKADNTFIISYILKDMNLFVEKKTNVGLFNLRDPLNMKLFIFSSSDLSPKILLQSFKIYI